MRIKQGSYYLWNNSPIFIQCDFINETYYLIRMFVNGKWKTCNIGKGFYKSPTCQLKNLDSKVAEVLYGPAIV